MSFMALLLYHLMVCLVAPAEISVQLFISSPFSGEFHCPNQILLGERHGQKCCAIGDS